MSDPVTSFTRSIAVVGGGLSGALVTVHLLRQAQAGTRIALIERHPPAGRGVAYGTECADHLLNVPAGRMSVFPEDPEHFLRWVAERAGRVGYPEQAGAGDFLPRRIFGDYVNFVLTETRQQVAAGVKFENLTGEVVDIDEHASGSGGRLTLSDGRTVEADRVVLALGHLPGEYPIKRSLPFYHGRRYVHTPWQPGVLEGVGKGDDVLVVGAGLTAIDIIVQLDRSGHTGTVHALSRRGLRPQVHRLGAAYPAFLAAEDLPSTVRAAMHLLRIEIRKAAAQGIDWRPVVDSIRPVSQAIWRGFSWEERARFMRHVRPFWEVHRHRIAPQIAEVIERLSSVGRVKFYAGRLQTLKEKTDGVEAVFRRRGGEELVTLNVAKVINCTGPRTDYSKYQHPLLINLLARGLIDHDPLALGVNALPTGEVLRYRGGPTGWLFTLGAPLKGVLWESTAAPEIRVQARTLATSLLPSS